MKTDKQMDSEIIISGYRKKIRKQWLGFASTYLLFAGLLLMFVGIAVSELNVSSKLVLDGLLFIGMGCLLWPERTDD